MLLPALLGADAGAGATVGVAAVAALSARATSPVDVAESFAPLPPRHAAALAIATLAATAASRRHSCPAILPPALEIDLCLHSTSARREAGAAARKERAPDSGTNRRAGRVRPALTSHSREKREARC